MFWNVDKEFKIIVRIFVYLPKLFEKNVNWSISIFIILNKVQLWHFCVTWVDANKLKLRVVHKRRQALRRGTKYRIGVKTLNNGKARKGSSTVRWNGVLRKHFLGIKMQHWNKCLSSFLQVLLVFEGMPGKS